MLPTRKLARIVSPPNKAGYTTVSITRWGNSMRVVMPNEQVVAISDLLKSIDDRLLCAEINRRQQYRASKGAV